jgi:hypothetical protein
MAERLAARRFVGSTTDEIHVDGECTSVRIATLDGRLGVLTRLAPTSTNGARSLT